MNGGEWTAETVKLLYGDLYAADGWQVVADAHNAALAAEREEKERWQDEYARKVTEHENTKGICDILTEQLAAEKERTQVAANANQEIIQDLSAGNIQLREQLAAERSATETVRELREHDAVEIKQLREQRDEAIRLLAAAQAAMQAHQELACCDSYELLRGDTAALDAAIAAAQKPLVDALTEIKDYAGGRQGTPFAHIFNIAYDALVALAKVKDGK